MKNIELDRDTKVLLLKVLKQGYFTQNDMDVLKEKTELQIRSANIIVNVIPGDIPLASCEEEIVP